MNARDFSTVTELPGRTIGRDQFEVICRRYAFASHFVEGKRILEVGCGAGLGLGVLARRARHVIGGEVTLPTLRRASSTYAGRPALTLIQLDAHALPFTDGTVDAVLALAVIYYLDLAAFLRECRRVLAPGGVLIFCTPNKDLPGFRPSRFSTRYYSIPELAAVLSQQGFAVEFFGAFPVRKGAARLVDRATALGGTILAALPMRPDLRDRLRVAISRAARYERSFLDGELSEQDVSEVADLPLSPIPDDRPNDAYRVLYGVARPHQA